jgi:hypothetical protein
MSRWSKMPGRGILGHYMSKPLRLSVASAWFSAILSAAPLSVRLLTSLPSPQPVGTPIGFAPATGNVQKGTLVFRYLVTDEGEPSQIIRDFSQQREFTWSPALYEHRATIRVVVRNNDTKETAEDELPFRVVSRVQSSVPLVTPTFHPLIALFSAPPCPEGTQFRVAFHREGDESVSRTPVQPCRGSVSSNAYIAGMYPDTLYSVRAEWMNNGTIKQGPSIPFHTGILDGDFPPVSVAVPPSDDSSRSQPVLVHSAASMSGGKRPFATDLAGRVIWYLRSPDFLCRMLPGGRLLVLATGQNSANDMQRLQVLRELDLAGNIIRETNVSRVAEQLDTYGIHSECKKGGRECVSGFHHEAIRLLNGHTLVLAGLERIMPAGTQGSKEPVDVLGDLVIDLDEQFQVSALWNSFDHLDIKRASLQNAKCNEGPGRGGCTPIFLAPEANGWTHSNSLNYIPDSGDFLISIPEQDWVVKIDWRDGRGTGKIIWRLGKDGDFTAKTDDPDPWFSFQHDAGFDPAGSDLISVLDDGHARFRKNKRATTRGQVWRLDEKTRTAALVYNADLGVYSVAVGSAQRLKNAGYSFDAGFVNPDSVYGRSVETDKGGKIVYAIDVAGFIIYRSFRVENIYSAPTK